MDLPTPLEKDTKMKNVQIFNFNEFPVRTVLKDGEPLFALTDVAAVLDIRNPSPSRFNMSEKGVHLSLIHI